MNSVNRQFLSTQKIVSIELFKKLRSLDGIYRRYRNQLEAMQKSDLLLEIADFHTHIQNGKSELHTMIKGRILMDVVHERALTDNLKSIANEIEGYIDEEISSHAHLRATYCGNVFN